MNSYLLFLLSRLKGKESGFTLVELVIVILIVSILSAIALPSFLNQVNQARLSEARQNVGAIIRAQQTYLLENGTFGSLDELAIGVPPVTDNFAYTITNNGGTNSESLVSATPQVDGVLGYGARIWIDTNANGDPQTFTIFCEGFIGAPPALAGATECP